MKEEEEIKTEKKKESKTDLYKLSILAEVTSSLSFPLKLKVTYKQQLKGILT